VVAVAGNRYWGEVDRSTGQLLWLEPVDAPTLSINRRYEDVPQVTQCPPPASSALAQFWSAVAAVEATQGAKRLTEEAVARMLREQGPKLKEMQKQIANIERQESLSAQQHVIVGGRTRSIRELQAEIQEIVDAYDPSIPRSSPLYTPPAPFIRLPYQTSGPLFVDIQGGPAVRLDTGQPAFLPSTVAGRQGARGVLLEAGDFVPGYAGITTTNVRDLAMLRILSQNLPQWPASTPGVPAAQPQPWIWDPRIAFPPQGPVSVLTTPGAPGTTPAPQAFFPPLGGDVEPGLPRLIPTAAAGRTAQQDVSGLQPSTHPELHGQVDRAYWRRPFALASANTETTAAIGKEIAQWLKPGGFLELRLLRGGEVAQAEAIARQIPDARVVTVPRGAIAAYASAGQRPPGLANEQWAVLQEAGPDIRGEFGALGQGQFARIVRIYRGGPAPQQAQVGGADYLQGGLAVGFGALSVYAGLQDPNRVVSALKVVGGGAQIIGGASYAIGLARDSVRAVRFGARITAVGGYITAPLTLVDFYRDMQRKFDPGVEPMSGEEALYDSVENTMKLAGMFYPEAAIGALAIHYGVTPMAEKASEYLTPMFVEGISRAYGVPPQFVWGMK